MDKTKAIGKLSDSTPSVKSGKNYFLGIGINDYTSGLSALHNAVRDVERVGQILQAKYDFDILKILTNAQATRSDILKQLRALQSSMSADDSLLIYYSGHGHKETDDAYWVPFDSNAVDIHNYIPNAYLRRLIKAIPTRHTLLVADACYSGSFFSEAEREAMRGAADEYEKHPSRWAFCSGRYDQKVSDGPKGKHSPFAEAFITVLEQNTQPKIFIQELAVNVINRTFTASKVGQTPKASIILDCGDNGGQFVFSLKNNQADKNLSKIKKQNEVKKTITTVNSQSETNVLDTNNNHFKIQNPINTTSGNNFSIKKETRKLLDFIESKHLLSFVFFSCLIGIAYILINDSGSTFNPKDRRLILLEETKQCIVREDSLSACNKIDTLFNLLATNRLKEETKITKCYLFTKEYNKAKQEVLYMIKLIKNQSK